MVPVDQLNQSDGKLWYIPHYGVCHSRKGTLMFFNCGAVFKGTSLNCHMLQGPDLSGRDPSSDRLSVGFARRQKPSGTFDQLTRHHYMVQSLLPLWARPIVSKIVNAGVSEVYKSEPGSVNSRSNSPTSLFITLQMWFFFCHRNKASWLIIWTNVFTAWTTILISFSYVTFLLMDHSALQCLHIQKSIYHHLILMRSNHHFIGMQSIVILKSIMLRVNRILLQEYYGGF